MSNTRPTAASIIREAHALGMHVRILYTHAGDMLIEPCALTDVSSSSHVPAHEQAANQTDLATQFQQHINHAQKRAS